eukprot:TRINITY_DN19351_c0_g1_i3.p1 TRINITY_DN19351_c0_g1~~TRINITY_DN19351_c0_g1_i3.p1  ORF type:complete len:201 (-),score=-23.52 TRINITY_DN19351_c0_g1_i3:332-934(-)
MEKACICIYNKKSDYLKEIQRLNQKHLPNDFIKLKTNDFRQNIAVNKQQIQQSRLNTKQTINFSQIYNYNRNITIHSQQTKVTCILKLVKTLTYNQNKELFFNLRNQKLHPFNINYKIRFLYKKGLYCLQQDYDFLLYYMHQHKRYENYCSLNINNGNKHNTMQYGYISMLKNILCKKCKTFFRLIQNYIKFATFHTNLK